MARRSDEQVRDLTWEPLLPDLEVQRMETLDRRVTSHSQIRSVNHPLFSADRSRRMLICVHTRPCRQSLTALEKSRQKAGNWLADQN